MKCDTCEHKGICKYESNMKRLEEKIEALKYQPFGVSVTCDFYSTKSEQVLLKTIDN